MAWKTKSKYYSGQGVVLLGDTDPSGNPIKLMPVGNVSSLKLAIAVTNLEHKEAQTGQRALDIRLPQETKVAVSMVMESMIPENLAIAMRGGYTKKAATTISGEKHTAYLGMVSALKFMLVSDVVITTVSGVPVTLVPFDKGMEDGEWDYQVNLDSGSIKWASDPVTTKLVDATNVLVDYEMESQTIVEPLTTAAPEKFMRFEGLNTAEDMAPVVVEVFRFNTDPFKDYELINDNIAAFTLEGSALMDPRRPEGESAFYRQLSA